jgi:DNA-binding GntR family transcriptional regulator
MSPGPTFERVYLALKRQLREGTRAPGSPLEPALIGDELGSSFTPVRDALHRLVGEGMVDNPQHNGFAVPHPTEQALRDLYAWNGQLLAMILRQLAKRAGAIDATPEDTPSDTLAAVEALFRAIAGASGNREQIRAIAQLNDRLAPYRRAEHKLFTDAENEIADLRRLIGSAEINSSIRAIAGYHKRRVAAAPQVLGALAMD